MPKLHDTIAARLEELLAEPPQSVVRPEGVFEDKAGVTAGRGWCVSAASLVATVVSDPQHPYRVVASGALDLLNKGQILPAASMLYGQIRNLKRDFESGLLANLEALVSAQTFDDMLDHADAYVGQRRPEPAGVLAGVVFEDTIRKLSEKRGIVSNNVQLDTLLSELVRLGAIMPLERKEGTAAAALRTSATHARWTEFNLDQVEAVIRFTRRLIRERLAS